MAMDDRRLETIIGNLLRAGVLTAAALVLLGGVMYLAQHHSERVKFNQFHGEGAELRYVAEIADGAAHFRSEGLIQFGLLLLIATPIARVVMAVVGFYLEHDYMYTVVSLIVLGILVFSLLHAT
ncbi:MAG TPA: DUF1634 domain-containing protein [Candidatus Angelobacter sp.]|jgi:uncharacterized membrane protein|nr:DUF1634 domain-containing protein [Candidatus Angelobacter sp.]